MMRAILVTSVTFRDDLEAARHRLNAIERERTRVGEEVRRLEDELAAVTAARTVSRRARLREGMRAVRRRWLGRSAVALVVASTVAMVGLLAWGLRDRLPSGPPRLEVGAARTSLTRCSADRDERGRGYTLGDEGHWSVHLRLPWSAIERGWSVDVRGPDGPGVLEVGRCRRMKVDVLEGEPRRHVIDVDCDSADGRRIRLVGALECT